MNIKVRESPLFYSRTQSSGTIGSIIDERTVALHRTSGHGISRFFLYYISSV